MYMTQWSFFKISLQEYTCNPRDCLQPGDMGSVPDMGRSPGEGNDDPFQYSCLESSMDRGTSRATIHKVTRVRHNLVTKPPTTKPPLNGRY